MTFYLKTGWNNIKKNYRFYIPQILTSAGLLACFYIVFTMKSDERLYSIPGGSYLPTFMSIGTAVISLLSVILVLYTNSFLMRQRKREYGLYNVLGMEKRHIGRILFAESAISALLSVAVGALLGILFYKLSALLICNLFRAEILLGTTFLSLKTITPSVLFFLTLDFFAYLVNRISISRMKPVELLSSRSTGEKEPKVKWPVFIIGLLCLTDGYLISVTTKEPLKAILLFFVAVFLVIIGTYCLFTAGSIFVLKALRRNNSYYYNKKHLPAISGLLFRMKQNAVGLASICILATGVLVMLSSTVSLYSGMQDTLDSSYPQHLYVSCDWYTSDDIAHPVPSDLLEEFVRNAAEENGVPVRSVERREYLQVSYMFDGEHFLTSKETSYSADRLTSVIFITEKNYTALTGKTLNLQPGELAVTVTSTTPGVTAQPADSVTLHGKAYTVKARPDSFPIEDSATKSVSPTCCGIVLPDEAAMEEVYQAQKEAYGDAASRKTERLAVTYEDRAQAGEHYEAIDGSIYSSVKAYEEAQPGYAYLGYWSQSYWEAQESIVGMYGSLLFLGIILGAVCMFATVLIIYYKQISEGYEDRERYQIMRKVGMSDDEIKSTIRSQTLLVFFLPLVFAGLHTAFAFPLVNRLLHLIMLSSTSLFVLCTLITYGVFALIYVVIYSMTAKTYYQIVH